MDEATRIWTATTDEGLWVRIAGRALADDCPALRSHCEQQLSEARRTLYVVLTECEHFDSTFLGTLLCLQRVWGKPGGVSLIVVAPCETCRAGLARMGANHLFPVDPTSPPTDLDWQELTAEHADRSSRQFQQNVVEAHDLLAEQPGKLGDVYKPVAAMARSEFEQSQ